MHNYSRFLLLLVLCSACALANEPFAERVLLNGNILTVDARDSVAAALAIRAGRIVAVGSNAEISALMGPGTEQIDLHGLTATPGLLDSHAHFSSGGLQTLTNVSLNYPLVASVADVIKSVAARAVNTPPGGWVLGSGWDEGKLSELRYVYAADLDPVSADHPVWLTHTTGHYGVANSQALAMAGITAQTPDPPGGVIDRDAEGNPTGVLKESAMALVTQLIPAATAEQERDALRMMSREFNRECMTGLKDPGIFDATWKAYQDVSNEGALTVRVFALWHSPDTLDEARQLVQKIAPFTRPYETTGDDRLISGGIKLFADGSGGARTAWLWQDWNKNRSGVDEGNQGFPGIDPDVLRELIFLYHDAGLHMGVHAIGDRAIDFVVASYALALIRNPQHGLRHAIIHANIPTELAMNTMAALQQTFDAAYPEPQANFTWWIGDTYAGNFGPQRSLRLNPFHTFQQKGIHWGGGSDFDVTPFPARYGIWASMARQPLLGVYGADPFGQAEAVDVHTALRSFTLWNAHQMFLEDKIGSLEVGKYADIAVWNVDLYTAPAEDIKNMQCQMTLLQGEVVYRLGQDSEGPE
ncbi:MAG: amidohydrolase [Xanthomonadales bacterium]|nr:amidohydrolase [Xanthomonadales bacterium]